LVDVAAVTIDRPRADLYAYWRNFENLPRFSDAIVAVTVLDAQRSKWTVKGPADQTVEWVAIVTEDRPGERIAWRTEDADVKNAGWVEFRDGPIGRGSEVRAVIAYDPPLGPIGELAAKVTRKDPGTLARIELRRFKQVMETGEIANADPPDAAPRGGKGES
jgi:uncharacterized membrane protein